MLLLLLSIIAVVLTVIVYEDFKSRTVHAFWFPILFALAFIYSIQWISSQEILYNILINFIFLFIQGILLVGYFALKHKQWINITETYLGWGDILFIVAVLPLFNTPLFILFYLSSLLLTIVFVLIYRFLGKHLVFIPLAGIQAMFLLMCLIYHQFVHSFLFSEMYLPLIL